MSTINHPAWQPWRPSDSEPWNWQRVWHLHRRAGLGATWQQMADDLNSNVSDCVDRILNGWGEDTSAQDNFETMAGTIGQAAVTASSIERLQAWWLYRMLQTRDPLTERLTLIWHNHFATSQLKVDDVALMHQQNQLLRQHARGSFGELLKAVIKHAAMLVWLDADANRQEHPNENLARELMELFTLGEGNYTERDVKEAARCLTGWTVSRREFRPVPQYHDAGDKTVLGETGNLDGDALLDLLIRHPATSRRIAWRLCCSFFGEHVVDDESMYALAEDLRNHHLDINRAVETILRSRLFFSDANLGTKIASPVDLAVSSIRSLELRSPPPSSLLLAEQLKRMGQTLFYPPSVFGWQEGRSWINTRSLAGRQHFARTLVAGQLFSPVRPLSLPADVTRNHPGDTTNQLTRLLWGQPADAELQQLVADNVAGQDSDDAVRTVAEIVLSSPRAQLC